LVSFQELTKQDQWRFFWGFMWRALVATLISTLGGFVAAILIGMAFGIFTRVTLMDSAELVWIPRTVGFVAGVAIGLATTWRLVRWYFRADWFGFRLALVRDDA
jgi:flagellar biosynthesis protein FliQ